MGLEDILRYVKKGIFGGYYILFGPLQIMVAHWIFQKGAVLGMSRSYCLESLVKILPITLPGPDPEKKVYLSLREIAKSLLIKYGKEPDNFPDFCRKVLWVTDYTNLSLDEQKSIAMQKVSFDEIMKNHKLDEWLIDGISFGATYPELVKKMWIRTYETPDPQWEPLAPLARWAGWDLPEKQPILPLQEMQEIVLMQTAHYVSEYLPELLAPLSLQIE